MGRRLIAITLGLVLMGCGGTQDPGTLTLLVPEHLSPLVDGLLGALGPGARAPLRIRTDTQDRVIRQVNSGTPADLVVTGASPLMDALVADGHVEDAARRPLGFDELVVVTPVPEGPQGPPVGLHRLRIPSEGPLPGALAAEWAPATPPERAVGGDEREVIAALQQGEAAVVRETMALNADRPLSRSPTADRPPAGFVIEIAPLVSSRDPSAAAALAAELAEAPAAQRQVDAMGLGWPRGAVPPQPQPVR